jgi:hypothetical protein
MKRLVLLLLALAAACAPLSALQAAATVATAPEKISGLTLLDEVIVSGDLDSLHRARKAIIDAEDRFYARYNELNKDDRFDITCGLAVPTGQRLTFRVCQPRYMEDAQHEEARRLYSTGAVSVQLQTADMLQTTYSDEMKRHMVALVKRDPQLLRALLERTRLEQFYDELQEKKFRTRRVVWD